MLDLLKLIGAAFDKRHSWWLPPGSIRALLAILIVVAYLAGAEITVEIVMAVIGFYFLTRKDASSPPAERTD